ncbi:MAG: UDP-N-acetylmuramate--L-alanine ligase [Actinobacteria bacterium]|nr:UDP-N-acetylmuramate--L-alanine ligase [Actinomycetota bacterium]
MAGPPLDLTRPRRVHVVGAGGSGMAPLATILVSLGHTVSGSDLQGSTRLERLAHLGVEVHVGHDARHVVGAEVVVASTAVAGDNPELVAARGAGAVVARRADALAALCALRRTLAVGGTHGKTTTTAMLATVLVEAGMAPSYLVGGDVAGPGGSAAWDDGEWFVIEADESDGTFLDLGAEAVVLTGVEPDHLDHHGSFDVLRDGFARFLGSADAPRVVCADDPVAAGLAAETECLTYGTAEGSRFRLTDVELGRRQVAFTLVDGHGGMEVGRLQVPVPGLHNARNAAAAAVAALALGATFDATRQGLSDFAGVGRRFEWRGEAGGVSFVDSYDHLPGEVSAVLAAARHGGWRRIVCVFQPHRYTRTAALWRDFAGAFHDADVLAVTDVYPAGQTPLPGVTGKLIVDAVLDSSPFKRVAWLPSRADVLAWLATELRPGDLCLTLGAGDLTTVPDEVLATRR